MNSFTAPTAHRPDHDPALSAATAGADMEVSRASQQAWSCWSLEKRLQVLSSFRLALAERCLSVAQAVDIPNRQVADSLAAEVLPLADACRFLERRAAGVLRPRRLALRDRPAWLWGVRGEVRREPFGVVLVIGPGNYPLMLPAVQTLQALVAGNAVLWKPGTGGTAAALLIREMLEDAGLPGGLIQVLDETPEAGAVAISAGVDLIVLTGSATTGRRVLVQAAESLTPVIAELSGCDAAFILSTADIDRAVQCLVFGLRFNGSATCIAPRRVFVHRSVAVPFREKLLAAVASFPTVQVPEQTRALVEKLVKEAVDDGARILCPDTTATTAKAGGPSTWPVVVDRAQPHMNLLKADIFAPVMSLLEFSTVEEALRMSRPCPYALGASIFGTGREVAELATRIDSGGVVINDLIVPTADPRAPFQGRRMSGFGTTRGAGGTAGPHAAEDRDPPDRRRLPHLDLLNRGDVGLIKELVRALHARSVLSRLRSGWVVVRSQLPWLSSTDRGASS